MKKRFLAFAVALGCLPMVALPLAAQQRKLKDDPTTRIMFMNRTEHAVWITIYMGDNRSANVARNCVSAGGNLVLDAGGQIYKQWWYNVLGEVKADKNSCANHGNIAEIYGSRVDVPSLMIKQEGNSYVFKK